MGTMTLGESTSGTSGKFVLTTSGAINPGTLAPVDEAAEEVAKAAEPVGKQVCSVSTKRQPCIYIADTTIGECIRIGTETGEDPEIPEIKDPEIEDPTLPDDVTWFRYLSIHVSSYNTVYLIQETDDGNSNNANKFWLLECSVVPGDTLNYGAFIDRLTVNRRTELLGTGLDSTWSNMHIDGYNCTDGFKTLQLHAANHYASIENKCFTLDIDNGRISGVDWGTYNWIAPEMWTSQYTPYYPPGAEASTAYYPETDDFWKGFTHMNNSKAYLWDDYTFISSEYPVEFLDHVLADGSQCRYVLCNYPENHVVFAYPDGQQFTYLVYFTARIRPIRKRLAQYDKYRNVSRSDIYAAMMKPEYVPGNDGGNCESTPDTDSKVAEESPVYVVGDTAVVRIERSAQEFSNDCAVVEIGDKGDNPAIFYNGWFTPYEYAEIQYLSFVQQEGNDSRTAPYSAATHSIAYNGTTLLAVQSDGKVFAKELMAPGGWATINIPGANDYSLYGDMIVTVNADWIEIVSAGKVGQGVLKKHMELEP